MTSRAVVYLIAFLITTQNNCMETDSQKITVLDNRDASREPGFENLCFNFDTTLLLRVITREQFHSPENLNTSPFDKKGNELDEKEVYIEKFNKLSAKERSLRINRGAIFNDTPTGLMHPAFSRLSPKELDTYFRKIDFPDSHT
ncbi:MAG TPA: hypothetical protein VHO47_04845 [Candidatus Babeliales bacterium]|nr:hypothetical protein [Candidatus Babeliales bacterium]